MHPFAQAALYDHVLRCDQCKDICNNGKRVLGYGSFEEERIMMVGEAPGKEEAEAGVPFIGQAGQTLRKLIKEAGMDWDHIYITNTLKCRPTDNRDPYQAEIENCRGYLAAQIFALQPSIIIALGRIAMEAIVNTGMNITKASGTFHKLRVSDRPMKIETFRDWIDALFPIEAGKPLLTIVMPLLHPQYINYNGGIGSDMYNIVLEKLKIIWKDYQDQKGWYTLLNDVPF